MISPQALSTVCRTMKLGCLLRVFPYGWDAKNNQLVPKTAKHLILYRIQEISIALQLIFMTIRFAQTTDENIPARERVVHLTRIVSSSLALGCKIQFEARMEEIRYFANAVLRHVTSQQRRRIRFGRIAWGNKPKSPVPQSLQNHGITDLNSALVLITSVLLMINPIAHAVGVFRTPCAPNFLSSMLMECNSATDVPMEDGWPVIVIQFVAALATMNDVFFTWTFNWTIVFLGLAWVKEKLNSCRFSDGTTDLSFAPRVYRNAQVLTTLLNDGFRFYLELFPSVLFLMTALLLFGVIKYPHIEFLAYIAFPSCAVRCLFEAITALSSAGKMNEVSVFVLQGWKTRAGGDRKEIKYLTSFKRSCKELACSAGSLYTFQNSIVLVSLDNCAQLTFHLLMSYRNN